MRPFKAHNLHSVTGEMRIVLADHSYLVREGTALLLREIDEVELVATVDGPEPLLRLSAGTVRTPS